MRTKHFNLLILFAFLSLYLYSSLSPLVLSPSPVFLLSFVPSQVFSPETMEAFLARTIVPKLAYCLQSLPITPHQQEIGTPSPSSPPPPPSTSSLPLLPSYPHDVKPRSQALPACERNAFSYCKQRKTGRGLGTRLQNVNINHFCLKTSEEKV